MIFLTASRTLPDVPFYKPRPKELDLPFSSNQKSLCSLPTLSGGGCPGKLPIIFRLEKGESWEICLHSLQKIMKIQWFRVVLLNLVCAGLILGATPCLAITPPIKGEKIKVEDVIAKHVESLGTQKALADVKTRVIAGTAMFRSKTIGATQLQGPAVVASDGAMSLVGIGFNTAEYSQEKVAYDGKNVTVGYIRPGTRSALGEFLLARNVIFKEGLFGGVYSSGWALLNLPGHEARIEYTGTKKVNGKEAHVLKYEPKGGSDVQIRLYFDKNTFQHVQTEYEQLISAQMGANPEQSASQRNSRIKLTEQFESFANEQGLVLPHVYKLVLLVDEQQSGRQLEWNFEFQQFVYNEKLDPKSFNILNN